ncbi:Arginase, catabolizes arginine to ornithine and urea [Ancistrocladus abbreviatus]
MENVMGLLRIRVRRGINLAVRDVKSSDPYVIVRLGKQKLKTRVIKKSLNPKWNDDLTLCVSDPNQPVKLFVYDRDLLSLDDKMGDAEFDVGPLLEAVKTNPQGLPNETIITSVKPTRQNCLSEKSHIIWKDGKIVQNMFLRLRNVECGEVELQLQWIDTSGSQHA